MEQIETMRLQWKQYGVLDVSPHERHKIEKSTPIRVMVLLSEISVKFFKIWGQKNTTYLKICKICASLPFTHLCSLLKEPPTEQYFRI